MVSNTGRVSGLPYFIAQCSANDGNALYVWGTQAAKARAQLNSKTLHIIGRGPNRNKWGRLAIWGPVNLEFDNVDFHKMRTTK